MERKIFFEEKMRGIGGIAREDAKYGRNMLIINKIQ